MFEIFASEAFHVLCVVAHTVSFISMVFLSTSDSITSDKMALFILKPHEGMDVVQYEYVLWWKPSIFLFLATFSGITAIFHTYYIFRINTHETTLRFLEYFFTASIMISVISILVGIRDVYSLIAIEGCVATTMIFGYLEEKTINNSDIIRPHYLGYIPYITAWVPIIWHFIRVVQANVTIPDFVIAIFVVEILLFSCFGFVQWYYIVKRNVDMLSMEGMYNLLSLTSKILLVWLCAGGIMAQ